MMTNYYRLYIQMILLNCLISLTNSLIPNFLPLGKLVGFIQIIILLVIYIVRLTKEDVLFLVLLFIVDFIAVLNISDLPIDLENIIFFTATVLMLWKFSQLYHRKRLKEEITIMGENLFHITILLLFFVLVALPFSTSWADVNDQRVFMAFCESGHKLSGNLCLISALFLIYFEDKKFKLFDLFWFCIPFVLVSLTGSRTYLVSYSFVMIALYLTKLKNYKLKPFLLPAILVGGVYILMSSSVMNRFTIMGSNKYISNNFWEATSSGRLIWWKIDIDEFMSFSTINKLFGKGFTFLYNLNEQEYGLRIDAHNDYITLLISIGLFGVGFYIWVLCKWFFKNNYNNRISFVIVTILMHTWNALISGVFGAQQYIFANLFIALVFTGNFNEQHRDGRYVYERKI